MIQVSFDGPNGNLAFLKLLDEKRNDDKLNPLIEIRTCGLYTLHRSFQYGESLSGWNVKHLSTVQKIFQESSSCRAEYESLMDAQSSYYLLQLCAHRSIGNNCVAKKARTI